tara:strand:+ start:31555 stop:32526 length:972 start_codon:yes stop_codon:yes gene_type:complete
MKILVTGCAGFIGYHVTKKLLNKGNIIVGIDILNNFYSVKYKKHRLNELKQFKNFSFYKLDVSKFKKLRTIFNKNKFDLIINLAAEVGVRNSIDFPDNHVSSNIVGFANILELSKIYNVNKLVYASSSSVYGSNKKLPYSINDVTDTPVSIYAATKKANELMAYSYSYLYGIKAIGLRFFTVYGPWGRPDMAVYGFTDAIFKNKIISLYNNGKNFRDYTYIDDVVDGIINSIHYKFKKKEVPHQVFNLGNKKSISTLTLLKYLENEIGKKAKIKHSKKAPGDVLKTLADVKIEKYKINYIPKVNIKSGIKYFVEWYMKYNKIV